MPDGLQTQSNKYRRACEVRFVASMDKDRRQAFYEAVMKARGEVAARELATEVKALLRDIAGTA